MRGFRLKVTTKIIALVEDVNQNDTDVEPFLESKTELEVAADVPLAYQMYDMIRASGTQGMTTNVSRYTMPYFTACLVTKDCHQ